MCKQVRADHRPGLFHTLHKWGKISGRADKPAWLVYGGDSKMQNGNVTVIPWRGLAELESSFPGENSRSVAK